MEAQAAAIQGELEEIELLISQAKTEAARHESRRAAAQDKLTLAAGTSNREVADLANSLVAMGRRAALMEAQVDLLEGKRKSITRLFEAIREQADLVRRLASTGTQPGDGMDNDAANTLAEARRTDAESGVNGGSPFRGLERLGDFSDDRIPPAVSRIVLSAQEDLRREIARAMHDGPAQSLTNIVLQAQIVERLMSKDPVAAAEEVHALTAMVQRTLDATKTFIFDVRPMVLDDLGLVPTLRRASRDRGARGKVGMDFESVGVDRRLPPELESGLFRMLDDALAAQVASKPVTISLHLDWGDKLVIDLQARRAVVEVEDPDLPPEGEELPPTIASMVEERRATYRDALEAARIESLSRLPERLSREIKERSKLLGIEAELLDEGSRLRLSVPLSASPG